MEISLVNQKIVGWDYQKDKEAKRVFERKKELQKLREKEKERRSKICPECRYPKHPGPCSCKLVWEERA